MAAFLQLLAVLSFCLMSRAVVARDITVQGIAPDRVMVRVDGATRSIRLGETVDGLTLLGVNAREARMRIDGEERRLPLSQDPEVSRPSREVEAPSVTLSTDFRGQFVTTGMINGRLIDLLVDTGADTVSMSRSQAARLGIDFRRFGKPCYSMTANGRIRCWSVLLQRVKVGAITVEGVEASIRDLDDEGPALLGMSFLGRVRMEHDGSRLKLTGR